jgi:serine/threonine protein kinase
MTTWNPQANDLFLKALELHSPCQRQEYLDAACAGNAPLRAEVDALLEANARAGSFLEAPAPVPAATVDEQPISEGPGTVIGPYKLLEQIGEGGFGVVFMAEQHEPVRRKVALKVLKPGMDTRQVVARFEAERQALALMDHPNIAKVFDGGATASGRPYFVMELVKGSRITTFCDESQLPIRERLGLFGAVCQAVQHAHQKGIIHRDIKPSNVLVSVHDTTPVVKIIDFGVAKALGQELTDKTLFTGFAQMIGTPLYMSPEQAGQSSLDADTRSDIYSLGVLLYELLTGTTPFDKQRFKEAAYDEMRRIIREEEPPRPSARLSTLGQAATTASARRRSDPKRLSQLFRGELDWIVMKCLEKDRNRRYETASALAADVGRYLQDEPVQACPPSMSYRLRKFTRRYKRALAIAATVFVAVLVAVGGLAGGIGWVARDQQTRRAEAEVQVTAALDESASWQQRGRLPEALSGARRALALLAGSYTGEDLQQRVRARVAELEFVEKLENVRLEMAVAKDVAFDREGADALYGATFRNFGLDVEALGPKEAGERVRETTVAVEVASALDHWAQVRRQLRGADNSSWKHLLQVARAADADELRTRMRDAFEREDQKMLRAMATSDEVCRLPATTLGFLLTPA